MFQAKEEVEKWLLYTADHVTFAAFWNGSIQNGSTYKMLEDDIRNNCVQRVSL